MASEVGCDVRGVVTSEVGGDVRGVVTSEVGCDVRGVVTSEVGGDVRGVVTCLEIDRSNEMSLNDLALWPQGEGWS